MPNTFSRNLTGEKFNKVQGWTTKKNKDQNIKKYQVQLLKISSEKLPDCTYLVLTNHLLTVLFGPSKTLL